MKLENPAVHATTLEHFWMPFTANRAFKAAPRLLARAEGMYYRTPDGREMLDGTAGLWCVNAGHARRPIVEAVQKQAATMDYAPPFSMAHPLAFEAATAVAGLAPAGMQRVFFTNSGSESADTAIKMALAYHRARGEAEPHASSSAASAAITASMSVARWPAASRQPQGVLGDDGRRRSHPVDARSRAQRLLARAAGARRGVRRRTRTHRAVPRSEQRRGGDRRANRGIRRRADPARGLSRAHRRHLRQARYPADLRRGHHRFRPPRCAVCRASVRHHAGSADLRQGDQQRGGADGRGDREERDLRDDHRRPRPKARSSSCTVTPTRRTRSPVPRFSQRRSSTSTNNSSSARPRWRRSSRRRCIR